MFAVAVATAVEKEVETTSWPCALVVVTGIAMAAAWLVVVMTLPWALVEVTVWGTSVTGALGVSWEKLVETATEPWALVVLCNTGIAATGAVETTVFPGSSVEVTAIGTIVAEGGLAAGAGGGGELFAAFGAC